MSPQQIAAIITAAARACAISPKAVQSNAAAIDTYQICVARRCAAVQLSHIGLPDSLIMQALNLGQVEFFQCHRIGQLMRTLHPDCRVHHKIAAEIPGAITADPTPVPLPELITAAAIIGGLSTRQVARPNKPSAIIRDYRSAALFIAVAQGTDQAEILAAFHLSPTTNKESMARNARLLSTVDLRFVKIISAIHAKALLLSAQTQTA